MDKRSGRNSSNRTTRNSNMSKKSSTTKKVAVAGKKQPVQRKTSGVSEQTKMYKFDEDELKNASVKRRKTANSSKGAKNKKSKKSKNKVWKVVKKIILMLFILGILAGLILAGIVAGIFFGFFGDDFKMTKEDLTIEFSNSEVYDADGNLICTLNGTEQRKIVSLEQMPAYLPKAYVAIEDERFYEHNGVDIKRTGAATVTYLLNAGNSSFGGSTITQQLVKNITDEKEDSALRKVKEMARAIQIEKEISKDDILELYLNIIYVGQGNIHGVALASEYYFNKDVSTLDIAESAFLAGINHTPNSYDPFVENEETRAKHISLGKDRTKTVLSKMLELGSINNEEYDTAVAKVDAGLPFEKGSLSSGIVYTAHTEAAISEIIDQMVAEKGMTRKMAETKVYGGGYKIYTTQVTSIQNTMQEEMAKDKYVISGKAKNDDGTLRNEQSQAALVIIDHTTGRVVGCVGQLGTKTTNGNLNRATQSARQVGSSMKPLAVIGPAIQEGIITPASVYEDKQTSEFSTDGKPWPKNYYKGFKGKQTVRQAIEISGNVIPVRILSQLTVGKSIQYLNKMGLTGVDDNIGLSLALGAKEFSPLQIAAAYATIANDGTYIEPTFYTKVVDSAGNIVIEPHQEKTEVFDKSSAYLIKSIVMEPVVGSGGTARYAAMTGFDVAAKTGTTDDDFDRWLCEFTPYYTAACWYGYDKNETIVYDKATPTNPAGGICSAVMKSIHSGLTPKRFEKPDDIVTATVCKDTGLLPSSGCPTITDIFIKSRIPTKTCTTASSVRKVIICSETGLLAIDGACPNAVEKTFEDGDDVPTQYCNVHKVQTTPTPTTTPSTSPSTAPTPTTTPTTTPTAPTTPTPTPTPTTTPTPTISPTPSITPET